MELHVTKRLIITILALALFTPVLAAAKDEPSSPPRAAETQVSTTIDLPEGIVLTGPEKGTCTQQSEGALRYSAKEKALLLCNGAAWVKVKTEDITP